MLVMGTDYKIERQPNIKVSDIPNQIENKINLYENSLLKKRIQDKANEIINLVDVVY